MDIHLACSPYLHWVHFRCTSQLFKCNVSYADSYCGLFLARHQGWIPTPWSIYFWPVVCIIIGLRIIFRPKGSGWSTHTYANWKDVTNDKNSDEKDSIR